MAEKEQMQPFWYQGYLIDPNEELPFSLEPVSYTHLTLPTT